MEQKANKVKKITAFSLIELSIVLIIIGIIIAGITQSSLLISKYRLEIARRQTEDSPIASIKGVNFWLDTTSEKSFAESEAENGLVVTNWRDINPQVNEKYDANSVLTSKPTYVSNCINSLPCLSFDGVDDYIEVENLNISLTSFTLFMVIKTTPGESGDWDYIFQTNYATSVIDDGQISLVITPAGNLQLGVSYSQDGVSRGGAANFSGLNSPYLMLAQEKTGVNFLVRVNGVNKIDGDDTEENGTKNITGAIIGSSVEKSENFSGQIGEIIFFDRHLKSEERNEIETYLNKKWGIES